jgi:NAD(P)-dependent dehydrogenase (short-subunit alcohol dehydrogenase family)
MAELQQSKLRPRRATMRMQGKAGVVTGAASGLGREVARLAAEQGAAIVVFDLDALGAKLVAEEILAAKGSAVAYEGDVTVEDDLIAAIARCRDEFGQFDFIHNNAAIQLEKPLHETSAEEWRQINEVNLTGVFFGCKQAVIAMRGAGGGTIVNSASVLSFVADPLLPAYSATKHGVLGLTRAVGAAYGEDGIRCNCVCPGDMETSMVERYLAATVDPEAARREMESHYPANKIAHPREVANVVLFLLSDESSFINGAPIQVDGGLLSKVY